MFSEIMTSKVLQKFL